MMPIEKYILVVYTIGDLVYNSIQIEIGPSKLTSLHMYFFINKREIISK